MSRKFVGNLMLSREWDSLNSSSKSQVSIMMYMYRYNVYNVYFTLKTSTNCTEIYSTKKVCVIKFERRFFLKWNLVVCVILSHDSDLNIWQWCDFSEHCKDCKNFNSMFSILSGLDKVYVSRLRNTWEKLPNKYMKMYDVSPQNIFPLDSSFCMNCIWLCVSCFEYENCKPNCSFNLLCSGLKRVDWSV